MFEVQVAQEQETLEDDDEEAKISKRGISSKISATQQFLCRIEISDCKIEQNVDRKKLIQNSHQSMNTGGARRRLPPPFFLPTPIVRSPSTARSTSSIGYQVAIIALKKGSKARAGLVCLLNPSHLLHLFENALLRS